MSLARTVPEVVWPSELETLYSTNRVAFVRLAYLMTGRRDVAEEIVQEAFVTCAPRWTSIERPRAYLRTVVANSCRTWLRRSQLDRERLVKRPEPARMAPDELWDALGRLDERRRVAVVLRYYQDLPDAEIAEVLDCQPGTVRTLIHRALSDLRREVQR